MRNGNRKKAEEILKRLGKETKELIKKLGVSSLAWEIVNFYHHNPFIMLTSGRLALCLGREAKQIESELEHLCESRLITALEQMGDFPRVYVYEPDSSDKQVINKLVTYSQGHRELVAILCEMVKKRSEV
jgi:hypothetical protein